MNSRLFTIFCATITLCLTSTFLNAKNILALASDLPGEGTPGGTPRPGGSRPENLCPNDIAIPLTAIFSNNSRDFTTQSNPKFWFYVPYGTEDVNYMEFTILDQHGLRNIYETQFNLVDEPGLISVSLPETPEPLLKANMLYRWFFKLNCQANSGNEPDQVVSGWIINIGEISDLGTIENSYLTYREQEIWYDAISTVFERYSQDSSDPQYSSAWVELLQFLSSQEPISPNYPVPPNYEELIGQPFVEIKQFP